MCGNVRSRKSLLPSLELLNILKFVSILHVKMNGVRLAHNIALLIFTSDTCLCLLHPLKAFILHTQLPDGLLKVTDYLAASKQQSCPCNKIICNYFPLTMPPALCKKKNS